MVYEHIVSLGYFCSTALELEKIGLRDSSMPFDWLISDWRGVEYMIRNNFDKFLCNDLLYQYPDSRGRYKNIKYDISFFHDFDEFKSFDSQLDECKSKYKRRIERFYNNICAPTLFIRYIKDFDELKYLETHIDSIKDLLQKYNCKNEIIFIANSDLYTTQLKVFYVDPDENDIVAREFLNKNKALFDYLNSGIYNEEKRNNNIKRYKNEKKKRNFVKRIRRKIKQIILKKYIHDKVLE